MNSIAFRSSVLYYSREFSGDIVCWVRNFPYEKDSSYFSFSAVNGNSKEKSNAFRVSREGSCKSEEIVLNMELLSEFTGSGRMLFLFCEFQAGVQLESFMLNDFLNGLMRLNEGRIEKEFFKVDRRDLLCISLICSEVVSFCVERYQCGFSNIKKLKHRRKTMSIKQLSDFRESQAYRLKIKSLGQQMKQVAMEGCGLSEWESEVLIKSIEEVYFSENNIEYLNCGEIKYSCVRLWEPAGKPLKDCSMVTVKLRLICEEDREELPDDGKQASVWRRRRKLLRISEEAREQGGVLTQEDLAELLNTDVRTIRRDIRELKEEGIIVATRGQLQDIGPGVTHRGHAVRLWIEGREPVEIARQLKHSLKAVENYLEKFKRVVYLRRKHFDDYQIALTIGISVNSVKTYIEIFKEYSRHGMLKARMAEIELVGKLNYLSQDEKKDFLLLNGSLRGGKQR